MDRYLKLDLSDREDALYFGKKFLGDRHKWQKKIREKRKELESVCELPAVGNSEVHSGHISKPTEKAVFQKLRIEEEITRYQDYETILTYGLNHISEEDRDILTAISRNKWKLTNAIIDELADKYDCDPRTIYNKRRYAIYNFVDAIRDIVEDPEMTALLFP